MQFLLWTIAIIVSAVAGYLVYRADKKRGTPYPWLTASLRAVVIFLTLLLLLAPVISITHNETQKPIIVFLQDNSSSIATALDTNAGTYRKNTEALLKELSSTYKVVTRALGGDAPQDSLFYYNATTTDISKALADVEEYYNSQNLGAVILATDGRYNQGSNPIYQQLALQCPLYTVGIGDSSKQKDISVKQVYYNKTASLNSNFEIRADILACLCNGYNNSIQITEAGNIITTSPVVINSTNYDRSVSFSIKASSPGLHHYIINIPVAEGEKNTVNNRKDVFVDVVNEKKNILIAAAAPHPDVKAIQEALSEVEGYEVKVCMADYIPSFSDYRVIILHQLPSLLLNMQYDIIRAKKPTWFIIGSQSNMAGLQGISKPVDMTTNPAMMRDVYPSYNAAFNSFTTPQNLQAVADKMPPLSVPSGNINATPDADILFRQRDGEHMPLWVLQHGNIATAITCGEGIWRWRLYEYKNFNTHNTIDECIRQTVAFLAANSNEKPFYISLPKYVWSDQEAVTLNAYLLNATNQQINTPGAELAITDAAGKKHNYSFEKSGNSYKLNTGIWPAGTYNYTAHTVYNGNSYTATGSFAVEHMPLEQIESGADFGFLYTLSKKYYGSFVPAPLLHSLADSLSKNPSIKPVIQTNIVSVPLIDLKWYFVLILLFAVAEWLLRKYWLAQ